MESEPWTSPVGDMGWTVDENFDFKTKNSDLELFCELYFSDSRATDGQTTDTMKKNGERKYPQIV